MSLSEVNPSPGRNRHPAGWQMADEAMAGFLAAVAFAPNRRRALTFEKRKRNAFQRRQEHVRAYDEETEQMRRMIAVENARWAKEREQAEACGVTVNELRDLPPDVQVMCPRCALSVPLAEIQKLVDHECEAS